MHSLNNYSSSTTTSSSPALLGVLDQSAHFAVPGPRGEGRSTRAEHVFERRVSPRLQQQRDTAC